VNLDLFAKLQEIQLLIETSEKAKPINNPNFQGEMRTIGSEIPLPMLKKLKHAADISLLTWNQMARLIFSEWIEKYERDNSVVLDAEFVGKPGKKRNADTLLNSLNKTIKGLAEVWKEEEAIRVRNAELLAKVK